MNRTACISDIGLHRIQSISEGFKLIVALRHDAESGNRDSTSPAGRLCCFDRVGRRSGFEGGVGPDSMIDVFSYTWY